MRQLGLVALICCILASFLTCEKDLILDSTENENTIQTITSEEVLQRAFFMAMMEWTPVCEVPRFNGSYYKPGITVKGLPYSSVKEINTYLFQDVSYYTFMTAVHNPKSVLYTEDISKAPYHGVNCATFYGTVCSSAVLWALDIQIPYYANQLIELPSIKKIEPQEFTSLKPCDIIWKSGHVQMIYNIEYKADTLYNISLFESAGSTHIKTYSINDFRKIWEKDNYVGYRYDNIEYSESPVLTRDIEPISYNEDLCPSKGDRSTYRTNDTIYINIFNPSFKYIVLKKNNLCISTGSCNLDGYAFCNLTPGIYSVTLHSPGSQSEEASFEVVDTDVSYSFVDGGFIKINFESSATADYVALCKVTGSSKCYPITDTDRKKGYILVPEWDYLEYYCKVIFKGKYGRIASKPLRVV